MKIALTSHWGYGAWFVSQFIEAGHKVDFFLEDPNLLDILEGIIPTPLTPSGRFWRDRHPDYSRYDLSIFDLTGQERRAEYSASLVPTIGDSEFAGEVESNRMFGIEVMEECGIKVPPYEKFSDVEAAKAFVKKTKKRYVFKPDGGQDQDTASTYVAENSNDMIRYLDKISQITKGADFILQEFIKGTEVSVEGWFNGEEFYLLNCTLEEKKFMNGGKGPNTGCSGNLVFTFANREPAVYRHGLCKMKEYLRAVGYRGMLDLNTIATGSELYGLEWTPRLGYDASACLMQIYAGDFAQMMLDICMGERPDLAWRAEFAAGIRLSIPPYPSEIKGQHLEGIPIQGIEPEDLEHTYLFDVMLNEKEELVSAGHSGFIAVPMGIGDTIGDAFEQCNKRVERVKIPNMQYRTDIQSSTIKRYNKLDMDGWL